MLKFNSLYNTKNNLKKRLASWNKEHTVEIIHMSFVEDYWTSVQKNRCKTGYTRTTSKPLVLYNKLTLVIILRVRVGSFLS